MYKHVALLVTSAFYCMVNMQAQTLRRPVAAGYIGLGAYSRSHADIFSFTANQASLARLEKIAIGIYGERRFFLNDLSNYSLAAGLPTRSGNFGLKAGYYGFSDYNETQAGLAYARKLGGKIDLGVQFNYNGISIAGYGNASAVSFEMGVMLHLTEKLNAGIHVNNPVGGRFGKDGEEKLPAVYSAGLGYDASEKFFISAELQKEEDQPVSINAGIQYKFIPLLLARAGIASATSNAWFGLGLSLKSFRLDITTSYHPELGFTPGLLLLFSPSKKEQ